MATTELLTPAAQDLYEVMRDRDPACHIFRQDRLSQPFFRFLQGDILVTTMIRQFDECLNHATFCAEDIQFFKLFIFFSVTVDFQYYFILVTGEEGIQF